MPNANLRLLPYVDPLARRCLAGVGWRSCCLHAANDEQHVKRWKEHRHETGFGHLYQGRYRCFPVETEGYFYQVVRYVERNALRANMVARAEDWRWSSLRRAEREDLAFPILSDWPLPRPCDWLEIVNRPQTEAELDAVRHSLRRGAPFGRAVWAAETAKQLKIESTLRPLGRPRKE